MLRNNNLEKLFLQNTAKRWFDKNMLSWDGDQISKKYIKLFIFNLVAGSRSWNRFTEHISVATGKTFCGL